MNTIVNQQRIFFNSNKTKDTDFRIEQLRKLKKLLKHNENDLNEAIYKDFQKSAFDTFTTELGFLQKEINEAIRNLRKWSKPKRVATNLLNFPAKSYIIPEPLGVSLIIGAWNYPYLLSLSPAIAAIAAGNTVVLKPSELPAHTSNMMATLINQNFDPLFFKVIEGGIPQTTELLEQQFDKIFFTGSVPVGKIVYQAAAKYLTPVTLELGGKSPAILLEDCQLEMSVKRLIWAKFLNAGQTCVAPDYVLVPENLEKSFLELAKKEIEKQQFSIENKNYTQIINNKNGKQLSDLLQLEKVFVGGNYNETTRIFEPTILQNISFEDPIMQGEIFGPILPVIRYNTINEAIEKVKRLEKPLACYVFTSSKSSKDKILSEFSFGSGCVNDAMMQISNTHLPFGGVGQSGIGSYHGENGFKAFSHYKSILQKPTWFELKLKYFPHTILKMKCIKLIMGVK